MLSKVFVSAILATLSLAPVVAPLPFGLFGSNKLETATALRDFHAHHDVEEPHARAFLEPRSTAAANKTSSATDDGDDECTDDASTTDVDVESDEEEEEDCTSDTADDTVESVGNEDDEDCSSDDGEDSTESEPTAEDDDDDADCSDDEDSGDTQPAATTPTGSGSGSSSSAPVVLNPKTTSATTSSAAPSSTPKTTSSSSSTTKPKTSTGSGGKFTGKGTWYKQNGVKGACGKANPDSALIGAMNKSQFKPKSDGSSAMCGDQVKVTANGKSVVITIADECPDCAHGSIDLSVAAFQKLASLGAGLIDIAWEQV